MEALGLSPEAIATAKTVGVWALAWSSLELVSYVLIRPLFLRLLERNPAIAGDPKRKAETATQMLPRVVCFVHNLLQVPLGLLILTNPDFYAGKSRIFATNDFSTLVMAISAGYFAYDTLECILRYEHEGPEFLMHGVFCFIVFASLVHIRCLHWFGAGFLMWEISTPFVHLRWFLYKIAADKGQLYKVNGLLLLGTFFLCRICWGPVLSVLYWRDSIAALATAAGAALPLFWVWMYRSCTLTMNGLNLYWFEKMVRIALDSAGASGKKEKRAAKPAAKAA